VLRRLLDNPWTYFGLAGLLFVVLIVTQFEIRLPPRSKGQVDDIRALKDRKDLNLLFIVIDTLRADHLHAYGYQRETSPTLDYLASTGVRFGRVISQSSWTKASMASMWTSVWPRRSGILRWSQSLPQQVEMPAEVLKRAGFRTAGIWRNGWVAPNFGFGQGFDTYLHPQPGRAPDKFQRRRPNPVNGTDEDLTVAAREFLKDFGHERFFLYVHYMDVHQYAYDEVSARFGTGYSDTYDNAIHWVDRNVGALLQELRDRDLWRNTVVVVAADHGEGFREHGLEGHARTLYREVAEVPWIISLPFELQPGIVVQPTVANVDIWPTLYDLLGVPIPPGLDGRSALPLIEASAKGVPGPAERPVYAEIDRTWGRPKVDPDAIVAVTLGPYRAIQQIEEKVEPEVGVSADVSKAAAEAKVDDPDGADEAPAAQAERSRRLELYDHRNDPWEKRDLAPTDPSHLPPELQEALRSYVSSDPPPWGHAPGQVQLQEMELNQLRALGYVIR